MQHILSPCPAGLDPASHPIKAVGTQRVALDSARMRLRVKPAMTRTHFDTPQNYVFSESNSYRSSPSAAPSP